MVPLVAKSCVDLGLRWACYLDGVSLTKTRAPRTPEQYSTVEDVSAENTIDYWSNTLRNHYEASGKDVPPDLKERLSKAFKRADGASADTDKNQNRRHETSGMHGYTAPLKKMASKPWVVT